jgi:transforming growth factor-beta-induced protein
MKNSFNFNALVFLLIVSLASFICKNNNTTTMMTSHTITDVAAFNPDFSSLAAALKRAGLDVTLSNPAANFTVFAPTNAAFTALLTELGVASLNDIPIETLTKVLLYHVKSGKSTASQISSGYYSTLASGPVSGSYVSLYVDMSTIMINSRAKITQTDVMADNGVIHAIDKVLLPMSISDHVVANPLFASLGAALTKADLASALNDQTKSYTVFAPTNDAFAALLMS